MARYRGTTAQRGLGGDHVADKKRLLALHHDGDPCWRCGQPMYKWQALDRDHVVDRALGGTMGPAVLAHASCNRGAGAKLGNQLQPRTMAAGRDTICAACGKPYHYAAKRCEICGVHFHPSGKTVRTCSRAHGVELRRRIYGHAGSKRARPKPPCATCGKPCNTGQQFCSQACAGAARTAARQTWPTTAVAYYTCRYCGQTGVAKVTSQPREVCPARACQLARLAANNLRTRHGLTADEADAQVASVVASSTADGYGRWQLATQRTGASADALWWTTVQPHRARDW